MKKYVSCDTKDFISNLHSISRFPNGDVYETEGMSSMWLNLSSRNLQRTMSSMSFRRVYLCGVN
jgi:hypothetical protein